MEWLLFKIVIIKPIYQLFSFASCISINMTVELKALCLRIVPSLNKRTHEIYLFCCEIHFRWYTMFIAAMATIAKLWKEPRCPSKDEWIKTMWFMYTIIQVFKMNLHRLLGCLQVNKSSSEGRLLAIFASFLIYFFKDCFTVCHPGHPGPNCKGNQIRQDSSFPFLSSCWAAPQEPWS